MLYVREYISTYQFLGNSSLFQCPILLDCSDQPVDAAVLKTDKGSVKAFTSATVFLMHSSTDCLFCNLLEEWIESQDKILYIVVSG